MTTTEVILHSIFLIFIFLFPAFLVAGEFSLVALRYRSLNKNTEELLQKHKLLFFLVNHGDQTARVIRFGKTFLLLILGLYIMFFSGKLGIFEQLSSSSVAFILAGLLVLGVFHYLVIELIPRALALHHPVGALKLCAPALFGATILFYPFLRLLRPVKVSIYRLLNLNVEEDLSPLDVEVQIRALGESTTDVSKPVRQIIDRALHLSELDAHDILLPRNQVQFMDLNDTYEENVELARSTGHTRFPLSVGDLDKSVGLIHIKDLFRKHHQKDLRLLKRPIITVKVDDKLDLVLNRLLLSKVHMALVIDNFGGTVGIVTLETILEELVGEIQDEFDNEEAQIKKKNPESFTMDGLTPLHDIKEELGIDFTKEDVSTIGGLVTAEMGKIPDKSEKIVIGNYELEVLEVDERRVISVQLTILPEDEDADDLGDGNK